ncbi:MAG: hypothetical protein WD696_20945 [Bryobacteraceae bacterium]
MSKKKAKAKNPHAMAMVRQRMKKLTPERRSEIARKAAEARWGKKPKPKTASSDHDLRVAGAIKDALASAKKELAVELAPIKSLPKRTPKGE